MCTKKKNKTKQRKEERKNLHSVHLVFFRCLGEIVLKTGAYEKYWRIFLKKSTFTGKWTPDVLTMIFHSPYWALLIGFFYDITEVRNSLFLRLLEQSLWYPELVILWMFFDLRFTFSISRKRYYPASRGFFFFWYGFQHLRSRLSGVSVACS